MRNLKRALSLGLTAAMISGLMVMGSSAASYADVTSENNVEAIEVLESVGIMIGDESGNFNPDQNVTRNEMAVVMANLMEYNVASYKDTSPFTDVPSWAEPYVAACWTNGITAGYSDTIYGGSDTVTTAQAALMLMKALGYFQYASDFGGDWQLATTRQGNAIDLFNGVDSGVTQAMTRNDVAQLVLNTLQAGTVEASTDGSWSIGDVVINNNVTYSYITSNQTYATAISAVRSTSNTTDANRSIVELGEQLYMGDLKLNDDTDDDFMRPARTWSYEGKEIGTYAKRELQIASYTTEVTGKDMYDLLSSATIRDNELYNYVDGVEGTIKDTQLVRSNNSKLAGTGDGVLTEVYLDLDKDEITIVSIDTWLAKATADYSESKEYAPLTVYTGRNQTATYNVDSDEVASVVDVAEDEFYQVNITYKNSTRGEVVAVSPAEVLEDSTVTKYSATDKGDGAGYVTKLTTGGTEYKRNEMAFYDEDVLDTYDEGLLTDSTYNVYLDQYGYFLGVDLYDGAKNYVFITGYDRPTSNLSVKTADAAGIFLDGTMKQIEVNVKDTNENIKDAQELTYGTADYFQEWTDNGGGEYALNRWYTYTVDANGVYTLKPAVRMTATNYTAETVINTANLNVRDNVEANGTRVYGEDASVFLTVDLDEVDTTLPVKKAITDVTAMYTGVQEVELEIDPGTAIEEAEVYTVYDSDYFIIGAIVVGEGKGGNANIAYLIDGAKSEEYRDGMYYWEFDCVMDGQVQTLTARSKYLDTIRALRNDADGIVELRFDGDYVVDVKNVTDIYGDSHYTNDAFDTSDFDVYDVTKANQLTLQGRTLYVMANQADEGLALTSDAKAVVIQTENNKTNVKTEFTSVSAAISHLADADTVKTGMQYKGDIIAALDRNGAATWVVFVSDTPLNTGSQQPGQGTGTDGLLTYNAKNFNGYAVVNYTVDTPEYAGKTSTVKYQVNILADGVVVATDTLYSFNATDGSDSQSWSGLVFDEDAQITAELKTLTVDLVGIKYVDENGNILHLETWKGLTDNGTLKNINSDEMHADVVDDAATFEVATDDSNATTLKYTITGMVNGNVTTPTVLTGATNDATHTLPTAGNKAKGDDYVTVTIYGLNALNEKYEVAVDPAVNTTLGDYGVTGANDSTRQMTIAVSGGSNLAPGYVFDLSNISVGLNYGPADAYAYKVTIGNYGSVVLSKDSATGQTLNGTITVNGDVTITKNMVTVTVLEKNLKVESAVWNDHTITLTFNEKVDSTTAEQIANYTYNQGIGSNNSTLKSAVASGKTVTLTFTGDALQIGNTIAATANIVSDSSASNSNKNTATVETITLASNGTVTFP